MKLLTASFCVLLLGASAAMAGEVASSAGNGERVDVIPPITGALGQTYVRPLKASTVNSADRIVVVPPITASLGESYDRPLKTAALSSLLAH